MYSFLVHFMYIPSRIYNPYFHSNFQQIEVRMDAGTGCGLLVQLLCTCALCICHCDSYLRVSTHTAPVVIAVIILCLMWWVAFVITLGLMLQALCCVTSCHPLLFHIGTTTQSRWPMSMLWERDWQCWQRRWVLHVKCSSVQWNLSLKDTLK